MWHAAVRETRRKLRSYAGVKERRGEEGARGVGRGKGTVPGPGTAVDQLGESSENSRLAWILATATSVKPACSSVRQAETRSEIRVPSAALEASDCPKPSSLSLSFATACGG